MATGLWRDNCRPLLLNEQHFCFVCLCCVFCRFPHPVTFDGMLEMSVAYLPVNRNWQLYIDRSQAKYDELQMQLSSMLSRLAKKAMEMTEDRFVSTLTLLYD